jgi:uroporphyrinogen III methyltransferase/synthase
VGSLLGRRIVVTRRREQSSALVGELEARGATVLEVPSIEIRPASDPGPLDAALEGLEAYDWVVFTSENAVRGVLGRTIVLGIPPRLGGRSRRLASIGASTSVALAAAFPEDRIDLQPAAEFRATGLLRAFEQRGDLAGRRVLLPASSRAREELPAGLRALGAQVDVVVAYETVEPQGLAAAVRRCLVERFDLALFASPSAVEAFAEAGGEAARGLPAAVIGPTTEAAARAAGFDVRAVAQPSTTAGLVAAACQALGA